jgi:tetratricopeptide (TPR) repeat protein
MRRITESQQDLQRALQLNRSVDVQKELGWVNLELDNISPAISLLSDYLQRKPSDLEAQNLLVECFYRTDRYEKAVEICEMSLLRNPCFLNNLLVCQLLQGEGIEESLKRLPSAGTEEDPFIAYNRGVMLDAERSWSSDGTPALKSKLLFEDYRFGRRKLTESANIVRITSAMGKSMDVNDFIVTMGRSPANRIHSPAQDLSRRHCLIVNYKDDVWIYDLGSALGTFLDGECISRKVFLLGVHELTVGRYTLRISSDASLLL